MMLPITGPFSETKIYLSPFTNFAYHPDGCYVKRVSHRQKRPYNLPLPFSFVREEILDYYTTEPGNWSAGYSKVTYSQPNDAATFNKAYAQLKDKLGVAAELSTTLAERKQAVSMIAKRSMQLFTFVKQLKRLQFADAARTLGVTAPPIRKIKRIKGRAQPFQYAVWRDDNTGTVETRARKFYLKKGPRERPPNKTVGDRGLIRSDTHKALANNFLEFHFGWAPLIKDIGNAVEVLQDPIKPYSVKGKGRRNVSSNRIIPGPSYVRETQARVIEYSVTLRTLVTVSNENARLADRMGFVNPAAVAWELVPFSFVIDWFVNVGDFLDSFTDFAGLDFINPVSTTHTREIVKTTYKASYGLTQTGAESAIYKAGTFQSVNVSRSPGPFPRPTLAIRPPWTLSPTRGAVAVALLIQSLK